MTCTESFRTLSIHKKMPLCRPVLMWREVIGDGEVSTLSQSIGGLPLRFKQCRG